MRTSALLSSVLLSTSLLGGCEMTAPPPGADELALAPVDGDRGKPEPPMLGAHAARGAGGGGSTGNPQLIYKGGQVMSSVKIQPIFWGTSWATDTSDKQAGIAQFYQGFVGSAYAGTNTEYDGLTSDSSATAKVTADNITYTAALMDPSAATRGAPKTSDILATVCRNIQNPTADGYYPVYTDTPRGHAGYCAWHSWGTCGSTQVQFAFFFKLDGDAGCDPQDPDTSRSQGLEALANVTGHELSEAVTDPRGNGWVDSGGSENADKCAWVFPNREQFSDGTTWLVQGNWSDAAYTAGTGYANRSGQKGCTNGGPPPATP